MHDDQWEYCVLVMDEAKHHGKTLGVFGEDKGTGYECRVIYYDTAGDSIVQQISSKDKPLGFNPFAKALALLGAAGWELVAVQHGILIGAGNVSPTWKWDTLSWNNKVCYLKRHILQGRAVNEPKLNL